MRIKTDMMRVNPRFKEWVDEISAQNGLTASEITYNLWQEKHNLPKNLFSTARIIKI